MKQTAAKLICSFLLASVLWVMFPGGATAENGNTAEKAVDQLTDRQLDDLDTSEIESYWQDIVKNYHGFLPETKETSWKEMMKSTRSGHVFRDWINGFIKYFFHECFVNGKLLGTLIILTVFSMLLQSIQNAFDSKTISKVAYAVVYFVLLIIALNTFKIGMGYATDAIKGMNHFLIALMPMILAMTATTGGAASVAFFHPMIIFLINISGWLVSGFILPLLFISVLLAVVSELSEHYKVTQLANLLRNIAMGTLAVFFAVFLGVLSIQGGAAAVTDGLIVKTAKFMTGNFVPVVGRMFTDATDTVISASAIVKNTVGLSGLVILICMAAFPAIKVLALALIYQLASAVLQPLGGGPVIKCLTIMGRHMLFVFAALAIVSLMFFLALTIIIAAGNLSLMIR